VFMSHFRSGGQPMVSLAAKMGEQFEKKKKDRTDNRQTHKNLTSLLTPIFAPCALRPTDGY